MNLEIDNIDEMMSMFRKREDEFTVFVDVIAELNENMTTLGVLASMKFIGFGGQDIIFTKDVVGTAQIPNIAWEGDEQLNYLYEDQVKKMDELKEKVEELRKDWVNKLIIKGFTTYRGVWNS